MVGSVDPNRRGGAHLSVLLERQHNFRGTVPASGDVFGHETSFSSRWFRRLNRASKTEVANLEVTVGIEQQVGRLEVSMYDIGRV